MGGLGGLNVSMGMSMGGMGRAGGMAPRPPPNPPPPDMMGGTGPPQQPPQPQPPTGMLPFSGACSCLCAEGCCQPYRPSQTPAV